MTIYTSENTQEFINKEAFITFGVRENIHTFKGKIKGVFRQFIIFDVNDENEIRITYPKIQKIKLLNS